MTDDLRRDFATRDAMIAYLKEQFPEAVNRDDHVSQTHGGRKAAEQALAKIDPLTYSRTRNNLNGAVTRLSAYLRHGVLSLAEVRDFAHLNVQRQTDAEKLLTELGWRDYWQRIYAKIGEGIWVDQEDYKTGYSAKHYDEELPQDIENGETGLVCIDSFSHELHETGYLHNHVRMWMAAYIVHWRRVKWQAGAKWFLTHLLDGDPASNNLSWQWVASTFSHKPYFFNRENLEKFTEGVYCKRCPSYGKCDFEGTYEAIEADLFPIAPSQDQEGKRKDKRR